MIGTGNIIKLFNRSSRMKLSQTLAASAILICCSHSCAVPSATMEQQIDSTTFDTWVNTICSQSTCKPAEVRAFIPSHLSRTPGGTKALYITKGSQKYVLMHNFNPEFPADFQFLAFLPVNITQPWTEPRLNDVLTWMTALSGGSLTVSQMQQCIQALKRTGYPSRRLGEYSDPNRLKTIVLTEKTTATGNCQWLNLKKNVSFGFFGLSY